MGYLYIILGLVFALNFVMLFSRRARVKAMAKKAAVERAAAEKSLSDLKRKLEHEQIDAERRVELRERMFGMLDTARRRGEVSDSYDDDEEDAGADTVKNRDSGGDM